MSSSGLVTRCTVPSRNSDLSLSSTCPDGLPRFDYHSDPKKIAAAYDPQRATYGDIGRLYRFRPIKLEIHEITPH